MTSLTVAVLHYNKVGLTKTCVDSITPQLTKEVEFFVVDNGSDFDGRFRPPPFVYFHKDNATNIGGQNRCFEHATNDLVLFVSNDILLIPGCINRLLSVALIQDYGQLQPVLWTLQGALDNAGLDYVWPGYGISRKAYGNIIQETPVVPSICYMMKKSAWEKMGGFDENLPSAYEDVDMGLRLRKKGFKNYVVGDAHAIHAGNATLKEMPNVRKRFHQARIQVVQKNFTGLNQACRIGAIRFLDRINNTWNNLRK